MKELAEHILAVANKNKVEINNLKLQKIMFFCIRGYLMKHSDNYQDDKFIRELYNENFEAWSYGPVIPSVYREYELYGSMPIFDSGKYRKKYKIFDKTIVSLLKFDVFCLVSATQKQSIYRKNCDDIIKNHKVIKYGTDDIIETPESK